MDALGKYKVTTNPPKIRAERAKKAPIETIRKRFISGVEKQKAQARAWKPGAKDLRSWVTRNQERGLAWVTVKYGARRVAIRGRSQSTIGPVDLGKLAEVFDDIKKAAEAGELDKGLMKAATLGPRKKKSA